ncbi:Cell division control protein 45 [Monocercomonoides exilis]|uniref:Cell division control protein 45 n=1 Tax=Monocercomonoides exilis TaxID=2049356 RepID=UPI00355A5507|nr:Cell division control protein 45 [Monocercomonoides exilis]|eukprot:MONOS_5829.1-p1 / transcript=MONOS_5829.1 / gene=MONOS_5829 / organism=Monocercomonoides_exilis_PA203 / gene_product=Cell division control protein 45 homolog / transcript_product=Cell division control protein 45 homolog / location=Mono_scaffold00175:25879-29409(-) / protein_length=989 / sequence_SO=supercontig / SO=protein_coding / is_pseudo=false
MIIQVQDFIELVYQRILQASKENNRILLISANDVDSVCTSSIITALLQAEQVLYTLIPVCSNNSLVSTLKSRLATQAEAHYFFLINCGAQIDLNSLVPNDVSNVVFFVLDNHRPYNLENAVPTNESVILIDDGSGLLEIQRFEEPVPEGTKTRAEVEEERLREEEEEGDDFEENDDEAEEDSVRDDIMNMEGMEEIGRKRKKKRKKNEPVITQEDILEERKKVYDELSYIACSSSFMLFSVASKINRSSNQSLWAALVGLSALWMNEFIEEDEYKQSFETLLPDIFRLNPQMQNTVGAATSILAVESTLTATVVPVPDYPLLCYRHTTLAQSISITPFFVAKLGLWLDSGADNIKELLAMMGVPIREANAPFEEMTIESQEALRGFFVEMVTSDTASWKRKEAQNEKTYGGFTKEQRILRGRVKTDMTMTAVMKQIGHNDVSAVDVACALEAILSRGWEIEGAGRRKAMLGLGSSQSGSATASSVKPMPFSRREAASASASASASSSSSSSQQSEDNGASAEGVGDGITEWKEWSFCFWLALNALSNDGYQMLMEGIKLFIETQKAVINAGTNIIRSRRVISTSIRQAVIHQKYGIAQLPLLQHPFPLSCLTRFLLLAFDQFKPKQKNTGSNSQAMDRFKPRPLLLSIPHPSLASHVLIVGHCPPSMNMHCRNPFSAAYEHSKQVSRTSGESCGFDGESILIDTRRAALFMEALQKIDWERKQALAYRMSQGEMDVLDAGRNMKDTEEMMMAASKKKKKKKGKSKLSGFFFDEMNKEANGEQEEDDDEYGFDDEEEEEEEPFSLSMSRGGGVLSSLLRAVNEEEAMMEREMWQMKEEQRMKERMKEKSKKPVEMIEVGKDEEEEEEDDDDEDEELDEETEEFKKKKPDRERISRKESDSDNEEDEDNEDELEEEDDEEDDDLNAMENGKKPKFDEEDDEEAEDEEIEREEAENYGFVVEDGEEEEVNEEDEETFQDDNDLTQMEGENA